MRPWREAYESGADGHFATVTAGGSLSTTTPADIARARMTYLQGDFHTDAWLRFVESTSVSCLFSMTQCSYSRVAQARFFDSMSVECLFSMSLLQGALHKIGGVAGAKGRGIRRRLSVFRLEQQADRAGLSHLGADRPAGSCRKG